MDAAQTIKSGRLPNLVFPRISDLEVTGYAPFMTETATGFHHLFRAGVNVIVGINGLGKTTLLNVIFRLLAGPYDPAKADRVRPGRKQSSLTRVGNFDFFRKRANDQAVDAKASATFHFADRKVSVERSLYDLRLLGFTVDGAQRPPADDPDEVEGELMDLLCEMMGLTLAPPSDDRSLGAHRYDFDFVVRNLLFFLEEKIPLIWNPDGQFVILRILLLENELSRRIASARNALLQVDSQYRNRLWAHNQLVDELAAEVAVHGDLDENHAFSLLTHEIEALGRAREDLAEERADISAEMDRLEDGILRARAEAFEAQTRLRHQEASYFNQAFRSVRSPGDLIVQALGSHEGCLVCGNHGEDAYGRARRLMETHRCPVCEADTPENDGVVALAPVHLASLQAAEHDAEKRRNRLNSLEESSLRATARYRRVNEELLATVTKLEQARRLGESEAAVAESVRKRSELAGEVEASKREIETIRAQLKGAVDVHERLIKESQKFIEARSAALIEAFNRYASGFMVEECRLRYVPNRRAKVAQSDAQIDWPAFEVDLASGHDATVSKRENAFEVSESQKEFIDLAFRMALLHVASDGSASMLAVETSHSCRWRPTHA